MDTKATDVVVLDDSLSAAAALGGGPVLVDRSHSARLLVLGTRESTGLKRMVLGSVSHYCLSHAEVPVVAVPTDRVLRTPGRVALPA